MDWRLSTYVFVGSALGGLARYAVAGWATRGDFPTGTLLVNATGCFLIGLVLFGGAAGGWLGPSARAFLAIGVLGGFTTMSSFTYETFAFLEDGAVRSALVYAGLTLASCFLGTWLGRVVAVRTWAGGA